MKKWICLFAFLCLLLPLSVSAQGERVVDREEKLTLAQRTDLSAKLSQLSDEFNVDIVALTVADFGGVSAGKFAEVFYDSNGYSDHGVLLLISMTKREIYITTTGRCISLFDDSALNKLEEAVIPLLQKDNVYGAFQAYANICGEILSDGENGETWYETLLTFLLVGAVIATIVVIVFICQLKSVKKKHLASDYVCPGSLKMEQSMDLYLYQTTTRHAKPKNNSGGGGGRSHGGRGKSF